MLSSAGFAAIYDKHSMRLPIELSSADNHNYTSKLIQRQQQTIWIPAIFRYVFPRNAFQRAEISLFNGPHFSFPPSPNRPETLLTEDDIPRGELQIIPSDITDLLNSIVIPDEFPISIPPPLHLDASKPIPGLDLSNDYLQSLHSDYLDAHMY